MQPVCARCHDLLAETEDLNADTIIDISDVNRMAPPVFFSVCTPGVPPQQ